jgi:putative transcriptional regulator
MIMLTGILNRAATSRLFILRLSGILLCSLLVSAGITPSIGDERQVLGFFLVASEEMKDPRFKQAVILVTPHHRGEVVGVVVNKPTETAVSTLFPQSELNDEHSRQLYFGGPLSKQSLLFLISSKKQPEASLRIFDDVFLSADSNVLKQVLRHPKPFAGLRIFSGYAGYAGYAGWKPGQLEAEVKKGYWLLREADTEILFNTEPGLIWRKLRDSPGKGYQINLMQNQLFI